MKKMFLILFIALNALSIGAYAQKEGRSKEETNRKYTKEEKEIYGRAEYLFEEKNYFLALPQYLKLEQAFPNDPYFKYRAGICYLNKTDEKEKAIEYLETANAAQPELEDILFYLGKAYAINYQFEKALELYNSYLSLNPSVEKADEANRYISYAQNGIILTPTIIDARIQNLGEPINSEASEYVPIISTDESVLIFTYRGERSKGGLQDKALKPDPDGMYYEDIFISYKLGDTWLTPEGIGDNINTKGHDAAIAVSNDGQKLFIYKSTPKDKGDIYISYLNGDEWSVPVPLGSNINTKYWEGSCSLSSDQNTLYFSSERPGGLGKRDIYKSKRLPDGEWGPAENLGPTINTRYNDDAPFIHPDGISLFFSSEGHNSIGGYDIFISNLAPEGWATPENLGFPINTTGDDIYYVLTASGEKGYYSSSSAEGLGQQDIYSVNPGFIGIKPVLALVIGTINADGKPMSANITVTNNDSGEEVGKFNSNSSTGKYLLALTPGSNYKLAFEVEGYDTHIEYVNVKSLDTYVQVAKDLHFYSDVEKQREINEDPENSLESKIQKEVEQYKHENTKEVYEATVYNKILKESGEVVKEEVTYLVDLGPSATITDAQLANLNKIAPNPKQENLNGTSRLTAGPFKTLLEAEIFKYKYLQTDSTLQTTEASVKVNDQGTVKTVKEFYPDEYKKTFPADDIMVASSIAANDSIKENTVVQTKSTDIELANSKEYNQMVIDFGDKQMEGLSFKLEIGAFENPDDFKLAHLEKYGPIQKKTYPDGITRYTMGPFKTLAEADAFREIITQKEPEAEDAFVTVFYFGQKKSVKEFFENEPLAVVKDEPVIETPITNTPCDPVVAYDFAKEFVGKDLNVVAIYTDFIKKCGGYQCDELIFKVQIGAYRFPKNFKYKHLAEFGEAEILAYPDGITRFTMKEFTTIAEAEVFRQKVIKKGTKDAWITAVHKGERKLLQDLIENNFYLQRGL